MAGSVLQAASRQQHGRILATQQLHVGCPLHRREVPYPPHVHARNGKGSTLRTSPQLKYEVDPQVHASTRLGKPKLTYTHVPVVGRSSRAVGFRFRRPPLTRSASDLALAPGVRDLDLDLDDGFPRLAAAPVLFTCGRGAATLHISACVVEGMKGGQGAQRSEGTRRHHDQGLAKSRELDSIDSTRS